MILTPTIGNHHEVSLYFHIPFCRRKCSYCHFFVLPNEEELKEQLLTGFRLEWQRIEPLLHSKKVVSIYFGGGTPFLFGPERIQTVLNWINPPTDAEITLEANPEDITLEAMQNFHSVGINRVSVGVQSLDPTLLHTLTRRHSPGQTIKAIEAVAQAGINNITIDLMYDLPGQTIGQWEATLQHASKLPITHLSLYNLTIEPHTGFFKIRDQLTPLLPDEEASLEMYERAIFVLENAGLLRYEISAFAKPGYESRHNTGYWTGRPFLGLGPSAFSFWEGKRFRNCAHLGKYCKALTEGNSPIDFSEELSPSAALREMLAINLRLKRGVALPMNMDTDLTKTIEALTQQELITREGNNIRLTPRGTLLYDTVASEIIET